MRVTNIDWDIDLNEAVENITREGIVTESEFFQLTKKQCLSMSMDEIEDYVRDFFHHRPGALYDYLDLPEETTVPDELITDEDITDWLSDEYGYCLNGWDKYEVTNIGFLNPETWDDDETQFDTTNKTELALLWFDFCRENGFITYVSGMEE